VRWFTREWASGRLSDDEWERRNRDYESYLASIRPELRNGSYSLVSDVNLHDAQLQSWSSDPDGSFRLVVLIGDLQAGYETVILSYEKSRTDPDAHTLTDLELDSARTAIWYDEIDVRPGGRYVHSILFHPAGELDIEFSGLVVERTPAGAGSRR
jgi:hypothetical protein